MRPASAIGVAGGSTFFAPGGRVDLGQSRVGRLQSRSPSRGTTGGGTSIGGLIDRHVHRQRRADPGSCTSRPRSSPAIVTSGIFSRRRTVRQLDLRRHIALDVRACPATPACRAAQPSAWAVREVALRSGGRGRDDRLDLVVAREQGRVRLAAIHRRLVGMAKRNGRVAQVDLASRSIPGPVHDRDLDLAFQNTRRSGGGTPSASPPRPRPAAASSCPRPDRRRGACSSPDGRRGPGTEAPSRRVERDRLGGHIRRGRVHHDLPVRSGSLHASRATRSRAGPP